MTRLLALLLVACVLSGCSDDQDAYCGALADAQKKLDALADDSAKKGAEDPVGPTLAVLEDLRAKAPEELQDEWDTVVFAWQDLDDLVDSLGVSPADLGKGAEAPDGVSPQDLRQLRATAAELQSPRVLDAARGIEDHAREVCKVEFDT